MINPAGLSYIQQFEIEPVYQFAVRDRTHGLGFFFSDSLNNPRFALALGYTFMRGAPKLGFTDSDGNAATVELEHFGHEMSGVLSIAAIRNWLYIGVKPKWQYTSLRYLDTEGSVQDARPEHTAFGIDVALSLNLTNFARVAVVAENLAGNDAPAWTESAPIDLVGIATEEGTRIDHDNLRRVADYPLRVAHGLSVFPLGHPDLSLNFDGTYDFSSFKDQDKVRMTFGGSGEFVAKGIPIRLGGYWDSRGTGAKDDRGYVSGGLGFIRSAQKGGAGIDLAASFSQQVTGTGPLDTIISFSLGMRLRPDL